MMDFGPAPKAEAKIEVKTKPKSKKRPFLLFIIIILLGAAGAGFYFFHATANPLPTNIKSQISYKAIYPSSIGSINATSYDYQADNKTLTFNAQSSGTKIVFTEQPAPGSLSSGGQVYYPALGLHPYAQFQSKLGPVALAKFYQSGSLKSQGQSAILATQGTLVIAHADKDLTNAQWKDLFDSLKITK